MVVNYPSGGRGTWTSCLTDVPRVLCQLHGSVIPHILPQLLLYMGLSVLAQYWNPLIDVGGTTVDGLWSAVQLLGILLSFLIVFKTQSAFQQFWLGNEELHGLMNEIRSIARLVVTTFDWEGNPSLRPRVRKVLRLLALYFLVVIEYFQRTGPDATVHEGEMRVLRTNVRKLTGDEEFDVLYEVEEDEAATTPPAERGSEECRTPSTPHTPHCDVVEVSCVASPDIERATEEEEKMLRFRGTSHANPMTIVFWLQLVLRRLCVDSRNGLSPEWQIGAPSEAMLCQHVASMEAHFCYMDQVDKVPRLSLSLFLCSTYPVSTASRRNQTSGCVWIAACLPIPVRADYEAPAPRVDAGHGLLPRAQDRRSHPSLRDAHLAGLLRLRPGRGDP